MDFLYWKINFWNEILEWNNCKLFALAKNVERRRITEKDLFGQNSLLPE